MRKTTRKRIELMYLIGPGILLIAVVTFYPAFYAIWVSLHATSFTQVGAFVGLRNYFRFFQNPNALQSIIVSLKYVIGTVCIAIPMGYIYSLILSSHIRGEKVFRSIILIPWIVSQVVIALLWKWFLDGTYGPFVYYLSRIGITDIHFFGEKLALPTLIFTNIWRTFPFAMVMILASLQTIPVELYESARTDGANSFQVFWKITFHFTTATLLITIIMLTLESFNMVTLIFTLTAGGPMGKTETLSLSVYKEAFKNWRLDYATTTGVIILIFNVVFSLGYIALLRREKD